MKSRLLFTILILANIFSSTSILCAQTETLKLLQWNVGRSFKKKKGNPVLVKNLEKVISTPQTKPDLIVLVEVRKNVLKDIIKIDWDKKGYTGQLLVPYKESPFKIAFVVLWNEEKLNLYNYNIQDLQYWPRGLSQSEEDSYKEYWETITQHSPELFYRRFAELNFQTPQGHFSLHPIHFSNIWISLHRHYTKEALDGVEAVRDENLFNKMLLFPLRHQIADKSSKAMVLKEIIQGSQNPLESQARNTLKLLKDHSDENAIVVGDFNAFPSIQTWHKILINTFYSTSKANVIRLFEKKMKRSQVVLGDYTFPTQTLSEHNPQIDNEVLIDLMFYKGPLFANSNSFVLPLEGSDHFPVMSLIQTQ